MSELKVLVTGGAGFIGSNLVDRLIKDGHEVVVIDNLSTGRKSYVNKRARFYEMDIRDEDVFRIFRRENFDIVYHLAAQCDNGKSKDDILNDLNVNVEGTINIIQNCAEYGVKKIIFSSTMGVYEDDGDTIINENSLIEPISSNAISKKCAEDYLINIAKMHDIDYCVLRYSNVYGVRQSNKNDGGIVYMTLDKIYTNSVPIMFGDDSEARNFVFVMDVVEANILAMQSKCSGIYNIAQHESIKQGDLYEMIIKRLKPGLGIIKTDKRYDDMSLGNVNINKANSELDWAPMFSIEDGIEITIEYYKSENGL